VDHSKIMADLREMVLHESPHSGLLFREDAYGKGHNHELIRDVIALANAAVSGPRYIVLGVEVSARGRRRIRGVARQSIEALQRMLPRAAMKVIEPAMDITLRQSVVHDRIVGIVVIDGCEDPPYLLSRDLSRSLHAGRGWVRRGTATHALVRADLVRMLAEHVPAAPAEGPAPAGDAQASLAIGFAGTGLSNEMALPALPLETLPSQLAAERLQKMLEGHASARDVLGRTETQFSRLLHAQLFGTEKSYEKHSDATLMQQLLAVGEENLAADQHYQFERRAHRLQLEIRNDGVLAIEPVTAVLTFMRIDGFGVSERVYAAPGEKTEPRAAYPAVEESASRFVVQTVTGRLRPGQSRPLFREPLRVWLREPAAGKTVLIDYTLQSRDLPRAVTGSLRLHVEPARGAAAGRPPRATGTG
jgi:hypothetical protein